MSFITDMSVAHHVHAISDFEQASSASALAYSAKFFTTDLSIIPINLESYSATQRPLDSDTHCLWRVSSSIPACYDSSARAMERNDYVKTATAHKFPYSFVYLVVDKRFTADEVKMFFHNTFIPF